MKVYNNIITLTGLKSMRAVMASVPDDFLSFDESIFTKIRNPYRDFSSKKKEKKRYSTKC